jgi:D-inositol-3-phosphate glycosyltransferase
MSQIIEKQNKIAFYITSTGWGGLEMNTVKLAESLTARGFEVVLISQEKSSLYINSKKSFANFLLLPKIKKHFDFASAKLIGNYLKKNEISTLFVFDNKNLDTISWSKRFFFKQLNVIYQQHMQIGINKKDLIHTLRYNSISTWISPLEYLKNEVIARTKFPAHKIKVIPLCMDITKFTPSTYSKTEALALLNIVPKFPLLGIIGRISEKKGQLFVVEALRYLKLKNIEIEVLIFGSATVNDAECQAYDKRLREKVIEYDLESLVHFVPHKQDVSQFYNAIDIFVLASHSETYGMVTIEAMLSNVPIIATKSGGTSEILAFGKLGKLYECKDLDNFSSQLIDLMNNPNEAIVVANEAQKTAIAKYAQDIEVTAIVELLHS